MTFSWSILEQSADAGGLPRYPIKAMILVGLVLLFLQALAEVIKPVAVLRGMDVGSRCPTPPSGSSEMSNDAR